MTLKKSAIGSWVKIGEEIRDGDVITILDEGSEQEGQFGTQLVFKIKIPNGEERIMSFNKTSQNNLIDAYGEDTSDWKLKEAHAEVAKAMVGGKTAMVAVLSGSPSLTQIPY